MVISIFGINAINMLTFVLCVLRIIAPEIIFGSINLTNQVGNSFGQLISYRLKMAGARPYFAKAEMQSVDEEPKAEAALPSLQKEIKVENLVLFLWRKGSTERTKPHIPKRWKICDCWKERLW